MTEFEPYRIVAELLAIREVVEKYYGDLRRETLSYDDTDQPYRELKNLSDKLDDAIVQAKKFCG